MCMRSGTVPVPYAYRLSAIILTGMLAGAPAFAGELYKWVDENGTVNYSNNPPAKTKGGKPPTVVEDRVSVYTPEKSVTDALERNKDRRVSPPVASAPREPAPEVRAKAPTPPPPPPTGIYDPCLTPGDPNCQILYDGPPVFSGRRRAPPLIQPQLPPGTIAGQSTASGGIIPGLSGNAPPLVPQPRPSAGGRRDREPERDSAPIRTR